MGSDFLFSQLHCLIGGNMKGRMRNCNCTWNERVKIYDAQLVETANKYYHGAGVKAVFYLIGGGGGEFLRKLQF